MAKISRMVTALLLLCLLFLLPTCTGKETGENMGATSEPKYDEWVQGEDGRWKYVYPLDNKESLEEVKNTILGWLEEADVGYRCTIRDTFYIEGNPVPAIWIYAINDFGEVLDAIILPNHPGEMLDFWHKDHCLNNVRKNEELSYKHFWHFPTSWGGNGTQACGHSGLTSDGTEYDVIFAGSDLPLYDVHMYNFERNSFEKGAFYWNGKGWSQSQTRPPEMNVPIDYDADPGEFDQYRTYKPAESLDAELAVMQSRLEATGLGYRWEMQDEITVDGKTYPVKWMYAVNENEEWVDVVFTEDPDLAYILQQNREIFEELRKEQVTKLNTRYPGRELNEQAARYANRHEYLVQDCFYHDYYFYMDGNPMAMLDCGCLIQTFSWSEEDHEYLEFVSRTGILDKNVERVNVPMGE